MELSVCADEGATPNYSHACHDRLVPKNQIKTRVSKNTQQVQLEPTTEISHGSFRLKRTTPESSLAFTGKAEQVGPALTHRNLNIRTKLHFRINWHQN